jgi:hypothetical protein
VLELFKKFLSSEGLMQKRSTHISTNGIAIIAMLVLLSPVPSAQAGAVKKAVRVTVGGTKKGVKETEGGVKKAVRVTEGGVKKGLRETEGGIKKGVKETNKFVKKIF